VVEVVVGGGFGAVVVGRAVADRDGEAGTTTGALRRVRRPAPVPVLRATAAILGTVVVVKGAGGRPAVLVPVATRRAVVGGVLVYVVVIGIAAVLIRLSLGVLPWLVALPMARPTAPNATAATATMSRRFTRCFSPSRHSVTLIGEPPAPSFGDQRVSPQVAT
jgi:hypothetical protein